MEWKFKSNSSDKNQAPDIVGLQDLKNELRKKGMPKSEIDRSNLLLKSALDFFQTHTGFIIQYGNFEFSMDRNDLPPQFYEQRKARDLSDLSYYTRTYVDQEALIFEAPVSAELFTQNPTKISFTRRSESQLGRPENIELTKTELDTLGDGFFSVVNTKPLSFFLNVEDPVFEGKNFSFYDTFNLKFEVSSVPMTAQDPLTTSPEIPDRVKYCLIKIATILYEYPDLNSKLFEDSLIKSTFAEYYSGSRL